jgi:predicted lipid-binding transport protein (Tim44 family)
METATDRGDGREAAALEGGVQRAARFNAGGLWWYMRSRRTPAPNFSGLSRTSAVNGSLLEESSSPTLRTATIDCEITSVDKAAFQQSLTEIQTAWSTQDLPGLRRLVTPEMLEYFSTGLAEQASQEIANRVEDVVLLQAEVREAWVEETLAPYTTGAATYVTAPASHHL